MITDLELKTGEIINSGTFECWLTLLS